MDDCRHSVTFLLDQGTASFKYFSHARRSYISAFISSSEGDSDKEGGSDRGEAEKEGEERLEELEASTASGTMSESSSSGSESDARVCTNRHVSTDRQRHAYTFGQQHVCVPMQTQLLS